MGYKIVYAFNIFELLPLVCLLALEGVIAEENEGLVTHITHEHESLTLFDSSVS